MRGAARATKTPNPTKKGTENLKKKKDKAQGWQREAKMAAVGRARQTAESLINSQLSRALYGEASEKDILLQYNAFCIGLLGAMLRNLAIFKGEKSFTW